MPRYYRTEVSTKGVKRYATLEEYLGAKTLEIADQYVRDEISLLDVEQQVEALLRREMDVDEDGRCVPRTRT